MNKGYDSYLFTTSDQATLLAEVKDMEENSFWINDVLENQLRLEAIDTPMDRDSAVDNYKLDPDLAGETSEKDNTQLLIEVNARMYLLRDTARGGVYSSAKLSGSALGRMPPYLLAQTINNGFHVARGKALVLMRYGKVSGVHSASDGGYAIMPISELLDITIKECGARFGQLDFKKGYNTHGRTTALWELPDAQSRIISAYQKAMANAVSRNYAINFMPALRFSSSDTSSSSVFLTPCYKMGNTYFQVMEGIQIDHRKRGGSTSITKMAEYEEQVKDIYAKFEENAEKIAELAQIEVWHGCNAVIGLCNKFNIPRKYGEVARSEVERFTNGIDCISAHDVYLAFVQAVAEAENQNATPGTIAKLEEALGKIVKVDWSEYDVGGTVAWASKGAQPQS